LGAEAAQLGAEARLRGADAVYAAVARRFGTILVTRDRQQLERLGPLLSVVTPEELLPQE
jgi:predicted nucleic acid-binding protein